MSASDYATNGPRRGFLGQIAALGAAAALPGVAWAQGANKASAQATRIDVHHHLIYPGYLDEVAGQRQGAGTRWSPAL